MSPQRPIDSQRSSALPPDKKTDQDAGTDLASRLTITVDGPSEVGARVDLETASLGSIIAPELARGLRPRLDDPTRLMNGALHPRYAEWISSRTWADQHPLNGYLTAEARMCPLVDGRGYFDRKRVSQKLGPSGPKYWLVNGPLPTKAKIPVLAQLIEAPVEEVGAVVEQERLARGEYQSVISRCRTMPYKLLTYEQIRAGVPCPGCGRSWIGRQEEIDTDEEKWRAMHDECRAGRNGYTDSPVHCLRCCGLPTPSPEQLAAFMRIAVEAEARRRSKQEGVALQSPDVRRERQEQAARKRDNRIKKLEVELARLRAEQAQDEPSS